MSKTIKIDEKLNDKIRYLQYQYNTRKDIIAYIIGSNIDVSNERFEQYQDETAEWYNKFEEAKQEMVDKYIEEGYTGNWNLNFHTCTLTVD